MIGVVPLATTCWGISFPPRPRTRAGAPDERLAVTPAAAEVSLGLPRSAVRRPWSKFSVGMEQSAERADILRMLIALRHRDCVGLYRGFSGRLGGLHLHSYMTAVRRRLEACGVGYALKLWQHRLCLGHGIVAVRWMLVPIYADYDAMRRDDLVGASVEVPE